MDYVDWYGSLDSGLLTRWPTYGEMTRFLDITGEDHEMLLNMGIAWECRAIVTEADYQSSREFRAAVSE